MKRANPKKSAKQKNKEDTSKKYYLSEKQVKKIKKDATDEAIEFTTLLFLSAGRDTHGWSDEYMLDLVATMNRYETYIDDKVLSIKYCRELLERDMDCEFKNWKIK